MKMASYELRPTFEFLAAAKWMVTITLVRA